MATIQLRDYQADMVARVRQALKRARSVLLQAPTGAGKTAKATYIASSTAAASKSCWFICHRAELVEGTSKTFHKWGVPHGIIAAGWPVMLRQLVQVCSIDTLKGRLDSLKAPAVAIIDEAHHCGAAGWAVVVAWLRERGTIIVGLSATPERLDGKGLDEYFDEIVLGPTVAWLMERGHLAPYRIFAPSPPADLKAKGDSDGRAGQAKVLDRPKLTGDVVAHWLRRAKGLRTVGFACNVQHSQHMVEAFNLAGIPSAHLDGGTPKAERRRIIKDFAEGRILVLWNVSLFGEGFDLAAIAQQDVTIDCVILNRQTQSLALYLQMVGRALRPFLGKVAIILDHAGNIHRHGFPDDEREWTLAGREGSGRGAANDNGPPPPVICGNCFNAIKRPLPLACPHCGKPLVAEAKKIEVGDEDLHEVTEDEKQAIRRQQKREQADAKTLDDLVALGVKRKYSNPMGWARKVYHGRPRSKHAA